MVDVCQIRDAAGLAHDEAIEVLIMSSMLGGLCSGLDEFLACDLSDVLS